MNSFKVDHIKDEKPIDILWSRDQRCVVTIVLNYKGNVIMLHDKRGHQIKFPVTYVTMDSLTRVLSHKNGSFSDPLMDVITKSMDENAVTTAYAYAGVKTAGVLFDILEVLYRGSFSLHRHSCPLTDILMNGTTCGAIDNGNQNIGNGYHNMVFSLTLLDLDEAELESLRETSVIVEPSKVRVDGDSPDVIFNGLRMNSFSSELFLLFDDYEL
jgi:hypothetical protein